MEETWEPPANRAPRKVVTERRRSSSKGFPHKKDQKQTQTMPRALRTDRKSYKVPYNSQRAGIHTDCDSQDHPAEQKTADSKQPGKLRRERVAPSTSPSVQPTVREQTRAFFYTGSQGWPPAHPAPAGHARPTRHGKERKGVQEADPAEETGVGSEGKGSLG